MRNDEQNIVMKKISDILNNQKKINDDIRMLKEQVSRIPDLLSVIKDYENKLLKLNRENDSE